MPPEGTGGGWKRLLRMGKMGAGVAGSYFGYLAQMAFLDTEARQTRGREGRARVARKLRQELQALRGPVMKIGQALAMQSHALPEELIAELTQLQMRAPGMHPSLMRAQFKSALGRFPEKLFSEFEPEPFAAASLGQVHRAVTRAGHKVAVKIQYPGIREAVRHDLRLLKTALGPALLSGHFPKAALKEMEARLLEETDYVREAANMALLRQALAGLDFVRVPKSHQECSTDKVLTMSFLEGLHLDDWLARKPTREEKDRLGARLMEMFYHQLFQAKAVHADPHWGNYLFDADGGIGLVDFGCVKRLDPAYVRRFSPICLYTGRADSQQYRGLIEALFRGEGLKPSRKTLEVMSGFSHLYRRLYPPFPKDEHRPVDFSDPSLLNDFAEHCTKLLKTKGLLPELVFVSRAEVGLYNTLHRLGAKVRTSEIVRRYLARA